MRSSINLAIRLFVITAISALVLAFANQVTEPIIEATRLENYKKSLKVAFPEAESFKPLDEAKIKDLKAKDENLDDIQEAIKGGKPVGHVYKATGVGGYSGNVVFVVGVDNENKIVGYSVLESQETPGIGSRIGDPEFVDSVIGKSMEKEISAVKEPKADNEIQALSGATYSTKAAKNALNVSQKANAGLK